METGIRKPTDAEKAELDYYFQLDEDILYMYIGRAVEGPKGALFSPDDAKKRGESHFEELKIRLRVKICDEWQYCKKMQDKRFVDKYTLAVSIADIITGLLTGIPPFSVVSLLLKMGLDNFCGCNNQVK